MAIGRYEVTTVTAAAAAAIGSGAKRLMGVTLYAAADGKVEFKNAATDTGTVLFTVAALAGTSIDIDLTERGGIYFSTGCFCKPAGAGNIAYVWTD